MRYAHHVTARISQLVSHDAIAFLRQRAVTHGLVALSIGCICAAACAADDEHITPYRPTVSNSAQLPVTGQLELELGVLAARNDAARTSLPYLLQLAFNQRWGILVGGDAVVTQRGDDGQSQRGIGNTSITAKRAFVMNDATAWGVELNTSLPTARSEIGGGKTDFGVNGILSHDLGKTHLDANLNLTRVGAIDEDSSHWQTGLSAALSTPLSARSSLATELSGTRRPGAASTAQALLALAFSPSRRLTIDVGVIKGLRADARNWSLFGGVVVPLAQLW